eukprot:scaffold442299_cov15-Prasinocladus_malaysianus.AAC.1
MTGRQPRARPNFRHRMNTSTGPGSFRHHTWYRYGTGTNAADGRMNTNTKVEKAAVGHANMACSL